MFHKFITLLLLLLSSATFAAEESVDVITSGQAAADDKNAREKALADALRNAVRQGAGVDILAESKVSDFELDYDRVMTRSMGYVETYKILSQGKKAKFYSVKIQATVKKGIPPIDNLMALKNLISRKRSPRVIAVVESSKVTGIELDRRTLYGRVEELANQIGLDLRSDQGAEAQILQQIKRAQFAGDAEAEKRLTADISSKCDFYISVAVNGKYLGVRQETAKAYHKFSLSFDLKAYRADDHSIIARYNVPALTFENNSEDMNAAFQNIVFKTFLEKMNLDNPYVFKKYKSLKNRSLIALVNRIITEWMTELDLGRKITLAFTKLDNKNYSQLGQKLNTLAEINWVERGEYDRIAQSFITVETKLNQAQLNDIVTQNLPEGWLLDRQTIRRSDYMFDSSAAPKTPSPKVVEEKGGMPTWVWGLIAAFIVIFLVLTFILLKVIKKK